MRSLRLHGLCGALAIGLLLAACGGDGGSTRPSVTSGATGGRAGTSDSAPRTSDGTSGTPHEAIKRDAVLRVNSQNAVLGWDPGLIISTTGQIPYHVLVYDRLLDMGPDGQLEPMLATDYEVAADGLSIDMTLRDDVVFHDGAQFDASVAVSNINRLRAKLTAAQGVDLSAIESVEAVDPTHLRIYLNRPDPTLLFRMAGYGSMMISPNIVELDDVNTQPIGSGPYVPVLSETNETVAVFERNEDYWNPDRARVARIEIHAIAEESTLLNAFRAGQLDFTSISPGSADQARSLPNANLSEVERQELLYFAMNPASHPALGETAVRQALSLAADRQAIGDLLLDGLCVPTHQIFAPGVPGYLAEYDEVRYDPDEARRLLESAGYGDGFELTLLSPITDPWRAVSETLQAQWREIGIDVSVELFPGAEAGAAFREGKGNINASQTLPGPVPALAPFDVRRRNFGAVPDGMEALMDQASALDQTSPAARGVYEEINHLMVEEVVGFGVCRPVGLGLAASNVRGVDALSWFNLGTSFDPADLWIVAE